MTAPHDLPPAVRPGVPAVPAQRSAPTVAGWPSGLPPSGRAAQPPPRRWPWVTAGLALGLLLGGAVGTVLGGSAFPTTGVASAPVGERVVTVAAPAPPPETITVTVTAPAPAPAPAEPRTAFGAGLWEVGVDIAAGKYKSTGTDDYGCYYARLERNDGTLADIITNGFTQGPATVTIVETDGYFETSGCREWVRVP